MANNDELRENFNGLTDAQRYFLELSYYEGLDEHGIAEKLKIQLPTVRSKLQLALNILKQKLVLVQKDDRQ